MNEELAPLGPLTVNIPCGGARHRVTWDAGALSFPDHDLEAEGTYRALGGGTVACAAVESAWQADWDTESIATVLRGRPRTLLQKDLRFEAWASSQAARFPPRLAAQVRLRTMARVLPVQLRTVLAAELGYRQTRPQPTPVETPIRKAATKALLETAPGPVSVRVFVARELKPSVIGWCDGKQGVVCVWLQRSWWRRIHSLGATVVDGTFVLTPGRARRRPYTPEAVRWERRGDLWEAVGHEVELEHDRDRWTLRWL